MRQHAKLIGTAAVLQAVGMAGMAGVARAQTSDGTYLLTFDGQVTPQNPTMTVGLWATWVDHTHEYLFGAGDYDLTAGDGSFLSGAKYLNGPGSTIGVLAGNTVTGAIIGQIHIPPLGIIGKRGNPILLATYEWTTTDFTPRSIVFETSNTSAFLVVEVVWPPYPNTTTVQMYPWGFTPGRNVYVIPTPASSAVLCVFVLTARRRRRGR